MKNFEGVRLADCVIPSIYANNAFEREPLTNIEDSRHAISETFYDSRASFVNCLL